MSEQPDHSAEGPDPEIGNPPPVGWGHGAAQPPQPWMPPQGQGAFGCVPVDPSAPFGRDAVTGLPYSDKSRTAAGLLQLLLPCVSVCGVGRLMTGHTAIGLIQLIGMFFGWITSWLLIGIPIMVGMWLWSVIDGIMMLTGSVKDAHGRPLRP